jgi:hypothetical protein
MAVAFATLRDAAAKRGITVQLQIFEGGETVRAFKDGHKLQWFTREYDHDETASAACAHWLVSNGHLSLDDFNEV